MKKLILLIFIALFSFQGFSQTSYKIKKKWDGSYEVTDTRAAQRMLIQGAYNSAPKFTSYRINPRSNRSYNNRSSRSVSNKTNNYIIVLNQSEKNYASENNSNITNETKKPDNSVKENYKYVKTYKVKTKEQIERENKERLEARQKKVNIIYEFNYQALNNKDISKFFISYSKVSEGYWGEKIIHNGVPSRLTSKSRDYKGEINKKVKGFINSINQYSDFGGNILEYPTVKKNKEVGGDYYRYFDDWFIKNENKAKALTLADEDLLYRYNKLNDEYEQFTYWYKGNFKVLHNKRNKVKKIQPKLNEVIAEINSEYARAKISYFVIDYGSGYIGKYRIPSKYIKIKNENGRVLYEAIYKNYSMIELVEELFVN